MVATTIAPASITLEIALGTADMLSERLRFRSGLAEFPNVTAVTELPEPTFADVLDAARQIRPYVAETPLRRYPVLERLIGANLYVKHENLNPTGAFKVRGGVNLISRLSEDERRRGGIGASNGNPGQRG